MIYKHIVDNIFKWAELLFFFFFFFFFWYTVKGLQVFLTLIIFTTTSPLFDWLLV